MSKLKCLCVMVLAPMVCFGLASCSDDEDGELTTDERFTVDGVNYGIVSPNDMTCEVFRSHDLAGYVTIPSSVRYKGRSLVL